MSGERSSSLRAPTKRGRGQSENSLLDVAKNAPRGSRNKAKAMADDSEDDIEINVKKGRGKSASSSRSSKESAATSKTGAPAALIEASVEENEVDLDTTLNDSDNDDATVTQMDNAANESDDGDTVPLDQIVLKSQQKSTGVSRRSSICVPPPSSKNHETEDTHSTDGSSNSPHGSLAYSESTGPIDQTPLYSSLAADLDRALKKLLEYEHTHKTLHDDNTKLSTSITTLQGQIEKEKKEKESIRDEYTTLQNELSHAEILINDMETVTCELRHQVEVQHETEDKLVKSLDDAVEEVQTLQCQISALEATLEGSVGEVNDVRTELSSLKRMNEDSAASESKELVDLKNREAALRGLLRTADMNVNALQIESNRLVDRVATAEGELATVEAMMASWKEQRRVEGSCVNEEVSNLQKRCQEVEQEREELERKHSSLLAALEASQKLCEEKQKLCEQVQVQKDELQCQVDELDKDLLSRMSTHQQTLKDVEGIRKTLDSRQSELLLSQTELTAARAEAKELGEKVCSLQHTIDVTTACTAGLPTTTTSSSSNSADVDMKKERELARKEARIKELEMMVKSLQGDVTIAENADRTSEDMAEMHRLMKQVETLVKEKELVSTALAHSQDHLAKVKDKLDSSEENMSKQGLDGDTLKRKVSDQQMKILTLETSLSAREGVLFDTQKKYDTMRKAFEGLEKEVSKKDDDITEMDNELFELRQLLQEAEDSKDGGAGGVGGSSSADMGQIEEYRVQVGALRVAVLEKEEECRSKEERIVHLEKAKLTKDQLEKIKHVKSEQKRLSKENKLLQAQLDTFSGAGTSTSTGRDGSKSTVRDTPVPSLELTEALGRVHEYEKERDSILTVLESCGVNVSKLRDLSLGDGMTVDACDLDISNTLQRVLTGLQGGSSSTSRGRGSCVEDKENRPVPLQGEGSGGGVSAAKRALGAPEGEAAKKPRGLQPHKAQ